MEPHNENKLNMDTSNTSEKSNLEMQLQLETSRELINERSPDLFSDDDDLEYNNNERDEGDVKKCTENTTTEANDSTTSTKSEDKETSTDNCIEKSERSVTKHIQNLLCGILPPPSVTYVQHDIGNLLSMYKRNLATMDFDCGDKDTLRDQKSHPIMPEVLEDVEWPHMTKINAYGLHYNRTKYTENIDMLFMKLVERNVGQETGSSFTYVSASTKKKPARKL